MTARTTQEFFSLGSPRKVLATAPPWAPVAPKTVMIFFPDIVVAFRGQEKGLAAIIGRLIVGRLGSDMTGRLDI